MNLISFIIIVSSFLPVKNQLFKAETVDQSIKMTRYGEIVSGELTDPERNKVQFILDNCPNSNRSKIDPYDVLALVRLEEYFGLPKEIVGILPAVFCIESGLQKGEDLIGDEGRALGPAQFHIAAYRTCITTSWRNPNISHIVGKKDWRSDFLFSARCWITNTMRVMKRIERECPDSSLYEKWQVAEANVSNWVRYKGHGCKAKSKHFKLLEVWHQSMVDM
jgi:hypothetical protein